ncbi:MAG: hypothetical protein JXQ96_18795 [Cyclobacteriaceae bacterium]
MESKIDESTIIDFLYGNLSAEDRQKMQEAMDKDPQLKKEVEEMAGVMEFMGKSEDKEVIPPSFVFEDESKRPVSFFAHRSFRYIASVAASLFILLMAGYVTNFKVLSNSEGMVIGFGSNAEQEGITKDEVRGIMEEVLTSYNAGQDKKLVDLEKKLSSQLESLEEENINTIKNYMASNSEQSREVIRKYINQSNADNKQMIADYFKVSGEQQKEYMNSVLTDFSKFYNDQRKQDLEAIRTGLLEYKDSNDQKQYETEVVLASLMDMVNTQNK